MSIDEALKILDEGPVYSKGTRHVGQPEHDLQVECVKYFRLKYRKIKIWANPSGGKRDKTTAKKLKAEGVIKGVPDLTIAAARKGYHGLYIEMKNGKKNNTTDEQDEMIEYLRSEGYKAEVARSFDDFQKIVKDYLE